MRFIVWLGAVSRKLKLAVVLSCAAVAGTHEDVMGDQPGPPSTTRNSSGIWRIAVQLYR